MSKRCIYGLLTATLLFGCGSENVDDYKDGTTSTKPRNIINKQYLITDEGQLASWLFNKKLASHTTIKTIKEPDSFEIGEDGSFIFKTNGFNDSDVDLVIEAETPEAIDVYNVDFVLSPATIINGYTSVVRNINGNNEIVSGLSVLPNETIRFHLSTDASLTDKIYITDVNNEIVSIAPADYKKQKAMGDEPWVDGFNYDVSATTTLEELSSGIYYVNGQEEVFFTVKNPSKKAKITLVVPTNTQNAYSCHGGRGLYPCYDPLTGTKNDKAVSVSFLRPQRIDTEVFSWAWDVIHLIRPFLNWIDSESMFAEDVQYITDADLDNYEEFSNSELLLIPGHNEYWSVKGQDNFNKYVDSGKDAIIAGGNIMWWNVRYEDLGRQLTSYKAAPEVDKDAVFGEETTYFHRLKDEDGVSRAAFHSIGGLFIYGGYEGNKWDKTSGSNPFRIIRPNASIFAGTSVEMCDDLDMSDNHEMDGPYIDGFDANGFPHVRYDSYKHLYNFEVLAYTWGFRVGHTIGTVHALQRKIDSGTVLQFGSNGAGAFGFTNNTGKLYRKVMTNAVDIMLNGKYRFESEDLYQAEHTYVMKFPFVGEKIPNIEACPR
ncbi:N,N-dimethylformamidase beta subunit family domain-containing protein [Pseudoalteromonas sp. YIC-656]|uniref:N,N-dimethylformamidase beta subunit family domain-containing protein n=1 Tax=Pseudoalteromonas pernae TaxID=3118054 RepID=UPI0032429B08